jgi:FkbM family methyltransferase
MHLIWCGQPVTQSTCSWRIDVKKIDDPDRCEKMPPAATIIIQNMHFLNSARNFLNCSLSPTGFALERTEKKPWLWFKRVATTRVGRYVIEVPTVNPLAWRYEQAPDLLGQLGRLTTIIRKKYLNLAAIDIGANVGDTVCLIKSAEDIPVLCIEGDAATFPYLKKNLAQFRQVSAHQLFLGENTGVAMVEIDKPGWNLTLKPVTSPTASSIQLTSLDDFMAGQADWPAFKLVKIDTEGFDCSILRGACHFLQKVAPVITFEYNRGNMDAIGEPGLPTLFKLQSFGYARIVFHDQAGRLMLATTLADHDLITDLHAYADCVRGRTGYLDITVFHEQDTDLADAFVAAERAQRVR